MSASGYRAFEDPYCYKGTFVLKNKAGLREQTQLDSFELEMTTLRAEEALPNGRFGPTHYRSVHRHLFQDVYGWAGRYRTVRTAKGGNVFCYPEHIASEMDRSFAVLKSSPFKGEGGGGAFCAAAADFLAELNAIHPFREGNGRSQLAFLHLLGLRAGRPMDMARIQAAPFLSAMIESFSGGTTRLRAQLRRLLI